MGEFNNKKKMTLAKHNMLKEKIEQEELYFNPMLNKLGKMRLIRSLQRNNATAN
jgi:hypothetical protein